MANERMYNDPIGGTPSTIGAEQFNDFYWAKKALIEARKEQYFMQLADVMSMPKHYGKTIKKYHYLPLLEDSNINDQGIDANGLPNATTAAATFVVTIKVTGPGIIADIANLGALWFRGEGASAAAAVTAAEDAFRDWYSRPANAGGYGAAAGASYAAEKAIVEGDGYTVTGDQTSDAVPYGGNLYGSSKDVGTITGKLPVLSEAGGRVNRVGFRRVELEGSIEKFGFFDEYTKESVDFDTDSDLLMHVNREMLNGASEITEDALQIDLLNSAGVVRFAGSATSNATVGETDIVTFMDLVRLNVDLDNNRCPKNTKIITGTRMTDTKTVNSARYMYVGSELIPTLKKMKGIDSNSEDGSGFISVEKYGAATTIANGEIGTVDQFRIIVVPEMMHWSGVGEAATSVGVRETGGQVDVFPMLVVGSESFSTIGFQTDGKTVKFKIKHVKPESPESYSKEDPYGEMGFMSIKWYYGFMLLRPERIALIKTAAEY